MSIKPIKYILLVHSDFSFSGLCVRVEACRDMKQKLVMGACLVLEGEDSHAVLVFHSTLPWSFESHSVDPPLTFVRMRQTRPRARTSGGVLYTYEFYLKRGAFHGACMAVFRGRDTNGKQCTFQEYVTW